MQGKSESQLRKDYGDEAANYVVKSRRVADRIDAHLDRLHTEYLVAVRSHRWATASHLLRVADPWIIRLSRVTFQRDIVLGKAWRERHAA